MITVFELRKIVNDKSSDKAKFYAGTCSLRKQLTNGFGVTLKPLRPIMIGNKAIVNNLIIDTSICGTALITYPNSSNIFISNIKIISAEVGIKIHGETK